MLAAAVHVASAQGAAGHRVGAGGDHSIVALASHPDSAVVPAGTLVRAGRAVGQLLSVPLTDARVVAALLALWASASVRLRERLAHAVVDSPRRGPPTLLTVA
jgi:hypothetical protein